VRRLEATITLEYDDEKVAEAVTDAVSPDNFKTPVGLTVKTIRIKNAVVTEVAAEGKMATFIATLDDLLSSVAVAEKTVRVIQER
jgi:tRNA threonylcarbamoyladenosine modification (KEOPS) complex  Pcc1 subunit